MRYWLYKCNAAVGGPAGYWGDWGSMVFQDRKAKAWGGHHSSLAPTVHRALDEDVLAGDIVVAYQSDNSEILGFCKITRLTGPQGNKTIHLKPLHRLAAPAKIHKLKKGTGLEQSLALRSQVMLTELCVQEVRQICA
jgi:predicted RNA-binding protein with PUA-like domain